MEARVISELDPGVWRRLPVEILEQVLGKLPLKILFLFRSVSSQWKEMIDTRVVYEGPPGKPVLFYHHPGGVVEGDDHWTNPFLAFPSSARSMWVRDRLPFGETFEFSRNTLVASHGGLLCFSNKFTPDRFMVYNPLNRKWRELTLPSPVLPKLPQGMGLGSYKDPFQYVLAGLCVNEETGNYQLLVAGIHEDGPREAHVYSSSTSSWETTAPVPPLRITLPDGEWRADKGVCCAGNLYWHIFETDYDDNVVKALLKFDLQQECWKLTQQSVPSESPVMLHITAHEGKVRLLEWYELEVSESYPSPAATELRRLGPEIKLMEERLMELVQPPLMDLDQDQPRPILKPMRGIGEGDVLYIVYQSSDIEDPVLRVQVYNTSSWLPKWDCIITETLLFAFAPTIRAYV